MRFLAALLFYSTLFLFPSDLLSQSNGTIVGRVYVREHANNTVSSLNYSVENRCQDEPCVRRPITSVELRFDDKYYDKSILDRNRVLPNMRDPFNDEFRKAYEANPNEYFWIQPGLNNTLKISDDLNFALSWGDKWACTKEKEKKKTAIICKDKDPTTPEYRFYGKFAIDLKYEPLLKEKFELKANYKTDRLFNDQIRPVKLPELKIGDSLDNCFKPPFVLHPGRYFYGGLSRQNLRTTWVRNYGAAIGPENDGTATMPLAYRALVRKADSSEIVSLPTPQLIAFAQAVLFLRAMLPGSVGPKDKIVIIGVNVFGEPFYGGHLDDSVIAPYVGGCSGGLTQATRYVFEGRRLCVCGCYTDDDRDDLQDRLRVFTLDGETIVPSSMGATTATFEIPEGTAPGIHKIGYTNPDLDGDGEIIDEIEFRVLRLEGKIDQSALLRGETTKMNLSILGTEDKIPLRITNKTPAVITITGGAIQVTPTAGGTNNSVERDVKGITPGNFVIDYSVDAAPCPCYASDF